MRIRLGKLKELVAHKAPADLLEYKINRVIERLITQGKFDGLLQPLSLIARWGVVALPPGFRTLEGGKIGGIVQDVTARYFDYLPGRSDFYGDTIQYFRDTGDNWATLYPLPLGGRGYTSPPTPVITGDGTGAIVDVQIRDGAVTGARIRDQGHGYTFATISFQPFSGPEPFPNVGSGANAIVGIENGKVATITMMIGGTLTLSYPGSENLKMTIYGTDQNFMPLTLTIQGNTTVANPFIRIDSIHKEIGDVILTLIHTSIANEITPLAIMDPGNEEAYYRRYVIDSLTTRPVEIISALCKVRHVELRSDADVVPFSNISAIELGLSALQYEAENDLTLAKQYWEASLDVLNTELGDMKSADEVPTLRLHYPGRTKPRMSSTM